MCCDALKRKSTCTLVKKSFIYLPCQFVLSPSPRTHTLFKDCVYRIEIPCSINIYHLILLDVLWCIKWLKQVYYTFNLGKRGIQYSYGNRNGQHNTELRTYRDTHVSFHKAKISETFDKNPSSVIDIQWQNVVSYQHNKNSSS
jgi:hypothetical protein